MRSRSPGHAILLGGLLAGTIDIGAACLINDRSVPFILQSIAGGLLAERALAGGAGTALLGLLLQEGMSLLIAAVYVLASRWRCFSSASSSPSLPRAGSPRTGPAPRRGLQRENNKRDCRSLGFGDARASALDSGVRQCAPSWKGSSAG